MPLRVTVASPCTESWESMRGDGRKRFCEKCQLFVHDLASLSEDEARELLRTPTGRVCARVFQRRDGTVLTQDCPVGVSAARRRAAMAVLSVGAIFLAIASVITLPAECGTGGSSRIVLSLRYRYLEAKERLRDAPVIGTIVNALDPIPALPAAHMLGKVVAAPPTKP